MRDACAPFTRTVLRWPLPSSPAEQTPHTGSKEEGMITEPQPHMIVLQLTDALLAQLRPFMTDLAVSAAPHSNLDDQEISAHSHVACYASIEQGTQLLTMRSEVYAAL